VADAAGAIRALNAPLDAVIANAGTAYLPHLQTRYGVERQFLVNHIGHFALVKQLCETVRNGTGRIVLVSGATSAKPSPPEGIMFDNLDGSRFYQPATFYRQSKLAVALFAKELARRLQGRGIAVNAVDPGAAKGTQLERHLRRPLLIRSVAWLFRKSAQRAAATQALLAASPLGDRHQRRTLGGLAGSPRGPPCWATPISPDASGRSPNESSIRTPCPRNYRRPPDLR